MIEREGEIGIAVGKGFKCVLVYKIWPMRLELQV
jgi:hypothetical protein